MVVIQSIGMGGGRRSGQSTISGRETVTSTSSPGDRPMRSTSFLDIGMKKPLPKDTGVEVHARGLPDLASGFRYE